MWDKVAREIFLAVFNQSSVYSPQSPLIESISGQFVAGATEDVKPVLKGFSNAESKTDLSTKHNRRSTTVPRSYDSNWHIERGGCA